MILTLNGALMTGEVSIACEEESLDKIGIISE